MQENTVKLIADSTHSLFKTQEIILNIVGNRFLEDEHYKHNPSAMTTLNAALSDSPSMEAIAIVTTDGHMTFSSGGYDVTKFPNLLHQEASRDSFLATLKSHKMVFGRTYYFEPIKQWITPIRKAIRDKNDNIVTIITAALRVKDSFGSFGITSDKYHDYSVSIVRDEDFYFQYTSKNGINHEAIYLAPMSKEEIKDIQKAIYKTHHLTIDEFKKNNNIASFMYISPKKIRYLCSLKYDETYKLWIDVRIPFEIILKDFRELFFIYCIIFILIVGTLFTLFKMIAQADKKRNAALVFQATHDQLTGLPNRSYLQNNIKEWIFQNAPPFSILYIDMDHFKNVNDSFGHQYGDALLVKFSQRLTSMLPPHSIIIRHGGDEFVIFTHLTHDASLLELAHNIIEAISKPYIINKSSLSIGASIGIAKFPDHGKTLDMLLRAADITMYEAKKIKNHAQIFANTMQEDYLKNVQIEHELRKAIENNELFMVYQPQIDAKGNIHGIEALARWNNALLGSIPPDQFIPIAETSGQMVKIGRFIIECTLSDIKEVQQLLGYTFQTSINISVRQFMDATFLEHLLETIHATQINQISITIEITENLFIEDMDYILPLLHQIRDCGIQISMDDFGTGYSSLSMLRKLPIDELKIDKSFIDTIVEDITAQKMVQNIISISKNYNMHVLAEGVETKEQKSILTSFGCDRFQGYYYSKPLSKTDLIRFLQR